MNDNYKFSCDKADADYTDNSKYKLYKKITY